jgi:hypothetical protein
MIASGAAAPVQTVTRSTALLLIIVLAAGACSSNAQPTTSTNARPTNSLSPETATPTEEGSRAAYITERENGRTVTFRETERFGFWLDEPRYPFAELDTNGCSFFAYVSNWSVEGPGRWPIGYQVNGSGQCTVRDRDFSVRIVGVGG